MVQKRGIFFVVSAPSGAGKRTILQEVFKKDAALVYSVSATSRQPRPGEVDGKDYIFLDQDDFYRRIEAGSFVEWAEVHGHLYGTLREELGRHLISGKDVILELDVQGMSNIKARIADVVTVFVMAPSLEVLEKRLRGRGTDTEDEIALRLRNARAEIAACYQYGYVIYNDVLDKAVADMQAIIRAERLRNRMTLKERNHGPVFD